jgi:hypothetical protein
LEEFIERDFLRSLEAQWSFRDEVGAFNVSQRVAVLKHGYSSLTKRKRNVGSLKPLPDD